MALGGMRDHVGGGFHRYSVDANWRVPHFEKMLYDQAQITLACLETYQLAADRFFAEVAEDTLEYVLREMTNPEGGFFSAEDADSVPPEDASNPNAHKTEGAFYLWTQAELEALLKTTISTCSVIDSAFDRTATRRKIRKGSSRARTFCTSRARSRKWRSGPASRARKSRRSLAASRMPLFQARLSRPRPHLDDKVLTGWNGLMLAAFARAGARAAGADARARGTSAPPSGRRGSSSDTCGMPDRQILKRRYRDGDAAIDGYAEDYAYLIFGLHRAVPGGRRIRTGSSGRERCRSGRTSSSGTPRTAAGSTRPAPIRASSCG